MFNEAAFKWIPITEENWDVIVYDGLIHKIEYPADTIKKYLFFDPIHANEIQKELISLFQQIPHVAIDKKFTALDLEYYETRTAPEMGESWAIPPTMTTTMQFTPPSYEEDSNTAADTRAK